MRIYKEVAERIIIRRNELKLKKEDMVQRITGLSLPQYTQWESGATKFSAKDISFLSVALECSSDYLLFGRDNIPKDYSNLIKYLKEAGINAGEILSTIGLIRKVCQGNIILDEYNENC